MKDDCKNIQNLRIIVDQKLEHIHLYTVNTKQCFIEGFVGCTSNWKVGGSSPGRPFNVIHKCTSNDKEAEEIYGYTGA